MLVEKDLDICLKNVLPAKELAGHAVPRMTATDQLSMGLVFHFRHRLSPTFKGVGTSLVPAIQPSIGVTKKSVNVLYFRSDITLSYAIPRLPRLLSVEALPRASVNSQQSLPEASQSGHRWRV